MLLKKKGRGKGRESDAGKAAISEIYAAAESGEHAISDDSRTLKLKLSYAEDKIRTLADQVVSRSAELEKLRDYTVQLEEGEKGLVQELTNQLAVKDDEISRIASLYAKKETENRKLSSELNNRVSSQKESANKLKELIIKRESETQSIIEGLSNDLESKNSEIDSLKKSLIAQSKETEIKVPDFSNHHKQLENLKIQLETKSRVLLKSEKSFLNEQKLDRSVQRRLKDHIAQNVCQIEELKTFIVEKERLVQELEHAFEKKLVLKEDEIRSLRESLNTNKEVKSYTELDDLKSSLQVKEETVSMMAEEIAKLKEQRSLLHRRLSERQKLFFESEKAYEEMITDLRWQHDGRIKSLVESSSGKEAALRTALEEEKANQRNQKLLLYEKEKKIEETLQSFAKSSKQLMRLQNEAVYEGLPTPDIAAIENKKHELQERQKHVEEREKELEGMDKYIKEKETDLEQLLVKTEGKISALRAKELSVERKEQLLLREQDALTKELEVLSNAGIEIGRDKDYLKKKIDQVEGQVHEELSKSSKKTKTKTPELEIEPESADVVTEEEAVGTIAAFEQAETEVQEAPKTETSEIKPVIAARPRQSKVKVKVKGKKKKVGKGKRSSKYRSVIRTVEKEQVARPGPELFAELGGYSELDEIKSVVDVGLQHGDSIEQIKESLITSGYSKKNVDKVLSSVKMTSVK
jgi:hypothetical protein